MTPAPAVADDSGSTVATGGPPASDPSNHSHARRHTRTKPDHPIGDRPCPWRPPRPVPVVVTRNNTFLPPIPAFVAPVPVFGDGAQTRAKAPVSGDLPQGIPAVAALPAAAVPAAAKPPATGYPASHGVGVPPGSPPPRSRPPVAPIAPLPAVTPPPAAPVLPPESPASAIEPPAPERLGYPDELRNADLARIFAAALPGLMAMAGMTALGGLIGYRQARAGYLLRTAGAGRFLR